jgi:hypothetical protein
VGEPTGRILGGDGADRLTDGLEQRLAGARPEAFYDVLGAWALLYGLIMLELFHHLQPIVGDAGALFRAQVEGLIDRLAEARTPHS